MNKKFLHRTSLTIKHIIQWTEKKCKNVKKNYLQNVAERTKEDVYIKTVKTWPTLFNRQLLNENFKKIWNTLSVNVHT